MCGIAGIISLNSSPLSVKAHQGIQQMNRQMRQRGPDDEGYLIYNHKQQHSISAYGSDTPRSVIKSGYPMSPKQHIRVALQEQPSSVIFTHRRLSIIDLSEAGHQPLTDIRQESWIIFNGEIYNYQEIKKELQTKGHRFLGNSDTEVILKAYTEWGIDCVNRFNGMFAFVLLDTRKQMVYLVRDRMGIKPLYISEQQGKIFFASDIKTIIASGDVQPLPNLTGLWHNLSLQMAPRPMTCFENISALAPGTILSINLHTGTKKITPYWNLSDVVQQEVTIHNQQQAEEELEMLLTKSIGKRLVADVEVATFMSGGIDSTLISALASKQHPRIKAFTLAFDDPAAQDELYNATLVAKSHAINHLIIRPKAQELLAFIPEMIHCYEEPFLSLAPNYILSKAVHEHGVKVILNGLGGDELFGGYHWYTMLRWWKFAQRIPISIRKQLTPYTHRSFGANSLAQYHSAWLGSFTQEQKKQLFTDIDIPTDELYPPPLSEDITTLNYYDILFYIQNHHLHRSDQFTMHFSLEGRFPFLDHELVEWSFRLDPNLKLHNQQGKYILKEVAKKHLPQSLFSMKKRGFSLPMKEWMGSELKDLVQSSLTKLKKRNFINSTYIQLLEKQHNHKQLWQLVMIELWLQEFIDRPEQFQGDR